MSIEEIGRDPAALAAFYREHVAAVPIRADCTEAPLRPAPDGLVLWSTTSEDGTDPWRFQLEAPPTRPAGVQVVVGLGTGPDQAMLVSGLADHPVRCVRPPR